ncbi:terminase [Ligilactobacillus pobuzihii]|uniref:terminase n=1 Tax=Ligilactobacillus pobuzihii TaxID=449659 RepID=UPI0019D14004|nr:terminase [Ligilactobacillus pobuzihii]MBN7275091.1 terminase [Ligilactobacillus pobuzihii]
MPVLANARQEKFVQGLIQGMSQRKAYRAAFKQSERWKDATVDNKASKLFKLGEIRARYNELEEEAQDEAIMKRKARMVKLSEIASDDEYPNEQMKAIDLLNKMDNMYIQKNEVTGNMKVTNPYKGLTTEQLIKLADSGGADD